HFPDVHRALGLRVIASDGFSDQLRARLRDDDVPWQVIECGPALHVIAEGEKRSAGMLLSNQFGEAIRSLRTYYDVVVVNGPLTSNELDCRVLEAVVDGVVIASSERSPFLAQGLGIFRSRRFSKVVS
ncbi:MAG TPA: hypothetical protein VF103_03910, partial [Polyangiaceae bacterium]